MGLFIWDAQPSKIFVGDTAISKVFLWDTQVRPSSRLPAEYQEVEWIQWMWIQSSSITNTMRIDTWINATSSVWVYAKMYKIWTRNDTEWFYASTDGTTSRRWLTTYPSGNWCPQWETWRQTNVAYNTQQWYEIKFNYNNNKQTLIDNTNIYSMTSATFNSNKNVFIGRESHWSSFGWRCAFFKITDWTTLVRDLVPCYRKSDNEVWMYDLVNDQFYTNAWNWAFTIPTLNSLQNINLTPTNEINITPNNNGSGTVLDI